jgi:aspartate racemase
MRAVVGILGGMGPAAGAHFLELFVQACAQRLRAQGVPVTDQAFPEHWLVQAPLPDRSAALREGGFSALADQLCGMAGRLVQAGAQHLAIACNTAHAWHGAIQARFPSLQVLHIAEEAGRALRARGAGRVGLLATRGTVQSGLYEAPLGRNGLVLLGPKEGEQDDLMRGIYQGVKAGRLDLAHECFQHVACAMADRHRLDALVLGCTEIPLVLRGLPERPGVQLLDATQVLAAALAARALPQPAFSAG